jgi:hypothetical protein
MCLENDEAILQGTKESAFNKQDHAFLVFEVEKCKFFEGKYELGYPECAEP